MAELLICVRYNLPNNKKGKIFPLFESSLICTGLKMKVLERFFRFLNGYFRISVNIVFFVKLLGFFVLFVAGLLIYVVYKLSNNKRTKFSFFLNHR